MESEESLQRRLDHWITAEETALRSLEYARNQIQQTNKRLELVRGAGVFIINALEHGIEDIGYYGNTQNQRDQV